MLYSRIVRPVLFRLDPEFTHHGTIRLGSGISRFPRICRVLSRIYDGRHEALRLRVCGIEFRNPVGLAAGFDKHGETPPLIAALGFGHLEVGSVSFRPWPGNPSPTLLRLPGDWGLINRLGLNSVGADPVERRLRKLRLEIPLGVNLVKTADPEIAGEQAVEDYFEGFRRFLPVGDFITLNLSCPNTIEGRTFEDPVLLEPFLKKVRSHREQAGPEGTRPVLAKLSPDLQEGELDQILALCRQYGLDGVVIGNTTVHRQGLTTPQRVLDEFGFGGVSGRPLKPYIQRMVRAAALRSGGKLPIIALGGVGCDPRTPPAQEVWEYLNLGASMVQLYTGLIYRGPSLMRMINRGLVDILRRHRLSSLQEFLDQRPPAVEKPA